MAGVTSPESAVLRDFFVICVTVLIHQPQKRGQHPTLTLNKNSDTAPYEEIKGVTEAE